MLILLARANYHAEKRTNENRAKTYLPLFQKYRSKLYATHVEVAKISFKPTDTSIFITFSGKNKVI